MSCLLLEGNALFNDALNTFIIIASHLSLKYGIYYTNIQNYFVTASPLTYVTNSIHDFVKCYVKRLGAP